MWLLSLILLLCIDAYATAFLMPPSSLMGDSRLLHNQYFVDGDGSTSDMDCETDLSTACNGDTRRSFLFSSFMWSFSASPAWAVKGAAEYDLEYYMRDLFMGNKPEGNLPASTQTPHPPRNLQGGLLPLLLDDEIQSCIPIQELAAITNIPIATISDQIKTFRSKAQPAFRVSHPWEDD